MRRFTTTSAISALLVWGMMLTAGDAVAQRRGGERGDRSSTSVSESRSQRGATTVSRGNDSRRERSTATRSNDRVSHDNKRSEVSNWPKVNRGSSGINDDGSRNSRNSQSRGDAMRRSFDERRQAGNNGGANVGNRPDNNNRPGGNISDRPGGNNGGGNRPGGNVGNRPDNNNRPGGNVGAGRPGNGNRPGGNVGAGRPGNGNRPGYHIGGGDKRPGGPAHRPAHGPAHAPDHHGVIHHRPSSWHTPVAPPHRSFRPVHYHICRPVPPPGFRPWHRAPIISGILGLTFGTAYYSSLDYLFTRGYEIDGYYNGVVYLRNIQELNCFWPDVMLNYGNSNALSSAEFHYSTSYDDLGRFNRLYSDLCARYGQPVTYAEDSQGIRSTWYGGNARGFVSLEYYYDRGRYYTTLSYGN